MTRILICTLLFLWKTVVTGQVDQATPREPLDTDQLPLEVRGAFTREHPGEKATWYREGELFRAEFIQESSKKAQVIIYDEKGNVMKRDTELRETREKRPAGNRYIQPADSGVYRSAPANPDGPASEVLRVEDAGLPDAPENKPWTPAGAHGDGH